MGEVLVLRGAPGSGKSYFAKTFSCVVSADDYFLDSNCQYNFDPTRLSLAHATCFMKFIEMLQRRKHIIVVDNSNITAVEIAPYMLAATAFGYSAEILEFHGRFQNVHDVPEDVVVRKRHVMEDTKLPPWWVVKG